MRLGGGRLGRESVLHRRLAPRTPTRLRTPEVADLFHFRRDVASFRSDPPDAEAEDRVSYHSAGTEDWCRVDDPAPKRMEGLALGRDPRDEGDVGSGRRRRR